MNHCWRGYCPFALENISPMRIKGNICFRVRITFHFYLNLMYIVLHLLLTTPLGFHKYVSVSMTGKLGDLWFFPKYTFLQFALNISQGWQDWSPFWKMIHTWTTPLCYGANTTRYHFLLRINSWSVFLKSNNFNRKMSFKTDKRFMFLMIYFDPKKKMMALLITCAVISMWYI